jgi:hypothetical protein
MLLWRFHGDYSFPLIMTNLAGISHFVLGYVKFWEPGGDFHVWSLFFRLHPLHKYKVKGIHCVFVWKRSMSTSLQSGINDATTIFMLPMQQGEGNMPSISCLKKKNRLSYNLSKLDERTARRLVKNRQSAQRSRERRLKSEHDLTNKLNNCLIYAEKLREENTRLCAHNAQLVKQIASMQDQASTSSTKIPLAAKSVEDDFSSCCQWDDDGWDGGLLMLLDDNNNEKKSSSSNGNGELLLSTS